TGILPLISTISPKCRSRRDLLRLFATASPAPACCDSSSYRGCRPPPTLLPLQPHNQVSVNIHRPNQLRFGYLLTRRVSIQDRARPEEQRLTPIAEQRYIRGK